MSPIDSVTAWDANAEQLYQRLVSGSEVTFDRILAPLWLTTLGEVPERLRRRVLEIGCGPGVLTSSIAGLCDEIIATDPSAAMCARARSHNASNANVRIEQRLLAQLADLGSFGLCLAHFAFNAIETLEDDFRILQGLLTQGARLIFSIPHPCFYHLYHGEPAKPTSYIKPEQLSLALPSTVFSTLSHKVPHYHRPLSWYTALLRRYGFAILDLDEVYPSQEAMSYYSRPWESPRYVLIEAERRSPQDR